MRHQGPLTEKVKRIGPHLGRARRRGESASGAFRLVGGCAGCVGGGQWRLPETSGVGGNESFAVYRLRREGLGSARLLVLVNFAGHASQCYVRLPFADGQGRRWQLRDLLGENQYERTGEELKPRGLYLDMDPWQYHVFEMKAI